MTTAQPGQEQRMEYPSGLSIDPISGTLAMSFFAIGGLFIAPTHPWLRALIVVLVIATNWLLTKQIRFLQSRARRFQ